MEFLYLTLLLQVYYAASEIRTSLLLNSLSKVRPVGAHVGRSFIPLTELPPPVTPHTHAPGDFESARRHLQDDCTEKPQGQDVYGGAKVDIFADYYDDKYGKTLATIVFPDHIDHKHFQVTTMVPYLTLGPVIEAIGYHPSTMKSDHPSECEKIYQDHLDVQYSEGSKDYSMESLEMARMPLVPPGASDAFDGAIERMYSDLDI